MTDHYFEVISLIERLHRQFLNLVKLELERLRIHDLNNVQGMLLFNLGDAEISIGELILKCYYLGSNVSYNVHKLSENGYLVYERSEHDRRSIRVRLTAKGRTLRNRLSEMLDRHIETLDQSRITDQDLQSALATLQRLERFWLRPSGPGSAILASAISAPEENAGIAGAVRLTARPQRRAADRWGRSFSASLPRAR